MTWDSLWINANLATMDERIAAPYGAILNGAIAIQDGQIAWLGPMAELPAYDAAQLEVHDAQGCWLSPGLIDCHSHIIYGGDRSQEFEQRLNGVSYDEIARRGGGIVSTVTATRQESEAQLFDSAARRLQCFLREGVTAMEIKSGYGLDRDTELKMLRVAERLQREYPLEISRTFLGAHTLPPEYTNGDDYIAMLCNELLPEIAQHNLADSVDVFCEGIGFSLAQTETLLLAAKALGLHIKAHVDQLSNLGGAALAANLGALSVDHLEYLEQDGINAMQQSGTVAVLLPGAYYFLRETKLPPIEQLRASAVPMALASDSNPGSSPVYSLLLMLNMACTLFRMTPEEALAGVNRNGAKALGWGDRLGSLAVGKQADMAG
jgi:imidazolonepropionase